VTTVALAVGALGLAVAAPGGRDRPEEIRLLTAGGAVAIGNSLEGVAVFSAAGLRPGQSTGGTLQLVNDSAAPRPLLVDATVTRDVPGSGGGRLADQLLLAVADTTPGRAPANLWSGAAPDLAHVLLGTLAAGEARTLTVTAALPLATGNAYQDAAMDLDLEWLLGGAVAAAVPTPTPTPTPTPSTPPTPGSTPAPPGSTPTPAPASTPKPTPARPVTRVTPPRPGAAAPVTSPQVDVPAARLGLPAARRCMSRRRFRIRVRAPRGTTLVSAVVRVNKRVRGRVDGRYARATVDLRGLPKGRFVVRIELRASDGRAYRATRSYRTCGR
jgi:hypothetical protein